MAAQGRARLETAANIATVVAVVLAAAIYFGRGLLRPSPPSGDDLIGKKVGVSVPLAQANLVLVLSVDCRFCTESRPLYQKVAARLAGRIPVVAVLPEDAARSRAYLRTLGIKPDRVIQASVTKVGAFGTPTILLTDSHGVIREAWVGKLSPQQEASLFARIASVCAACSPTS